MQPEHIFLAAWFVIVISISTVFLINGRESLKKFPKLDESEFEYIENWASGKTEIGGAENILQIRVTKNQLWLKTNTFMAGIAEQFGLLHLIPIESLKSVESDGKKINIEFKKNGRSNKIVLISRRKSDLIKLLNDKMDKKNS